jgi:hypothetical protein
VGTDIHLHIEVKIEGVWHHYSHPSLRRNYRCFAKLADVRNSGDITPIAQPRGMPEDATALTKLMCENRGEDGHSHSWLSAEEISEFYVWYEELNLEWPDNYVESWLHTYLDNNGFDYTRWDCKPDWLEDLRFVFWFDC